MTDATSKFFDEIGLQGQNPLLQRASGTIRFDLENGKKTDHWLLTIDNGDVTVAHRDGEADTTLALPRTLFEEMARGTTSPIAAVLRGAVAVGGDWRMLVLLRRLFTGAPAIPARPTATLAGRSRR